LPGGDSTHSTDPREKTRELSANSENAIGVDENRKTKHLCITKVRGRGKERQVGSVECSQTQGKNIPLLGEKEDKGEAYRKRKEEEHRGRGGRERRGVL